MNYKYVLIASQYFHDYNFMTLELKWGKIHIGIKCAII